MKIVLEDKNHIYLENNKEFTHEFPKADKVTLAFKGEEKSFLKFSIDQEDISDVPVFYFLIEHRDMFEGFKNFEYYYINKSDLEGLDLSKLPMGQQIIKVSQWLPFWWFADLDAYFAQILINKDPSNESPSTKELYMYGHGLSLLARPIYNNVFALMESKDTRIEGIKNSYLLFDYNYSNFADALLDIALKAHIASEHDDFDPDEYVKEQIEGSVEDIHHDPDDDVY